MKEQIIDFQKCLKCGEFYFWVGCSLCNDCYTKETKKRRKKDMKEQKYYIVRGENSGVFAGNIKERNGKEVLMGNVRRIWYWEGACSISQLAQEGTKKPSDCKFSVTVDEILILDAVEIDTCTEEAEKSIKGVSEWKI